MISDTGVSVAASAGLAEHTDAATTKDSATKLVDAKTTSEAKQKSDDLAKTDASPPAAALIPPERTSSATLLAASSTPLPPPPPPSSTTAASASTSQLQPPPPPPSIHKRRWRGAPKGILKPAPPPTKAFSFRRDILQQLNTRLAQQGVNVQVPVPQGSLAGTAQGTAQAASSLLGGIMKRVSGFAAGTGGMNADETQGATSPVTSPNRNAGYTWSGGNSGDRRPDLVPAPQRSTSMASVSSDSSTLFDSASTSSSVTITSNNNLPQPSASVRPLRKVRFIVSDMTVTYPISGAITPGEEDATRRRVEQEQRAKLRARKEKRWTVLELEQLYRECCRTREEHPLKRMRGVFQEARQQSPQALKTIDLSFVPLDRQAIEPVADLLSIEFGLQKLVLENCGLTDEGLKSILHALLVSGTLPNLSLASNKRIKYHGWRYVGIFMRRARALKYLDLSENSINRASLEHIVGALTPATAPLPKASAGEIATEADEDDGPLTTKAKLLEEDATGEVAALTSLRLENCGLKTASLEMLAQAVRFSALCHLSLRRNRVNQTGAVALAAMLKDYPDNMGTTADQATPSIASGVDGVRGAGRGSSEDARGRNAAGNQSSVRSDSPGLPQIPYIVSSPGGGVTRRTLPASALAELQEASTEPLVQINGKSSNDTRSNASDRDVIGDTNAAQTQRTRRGLDDTDDVAVALHQAQRAKRILSTMPRVGSLLTLDLKSNDIRGGIVYLSQALKKNRTLKVLNLSDNGIEMMGLIAVADALKYNSTLETLDLSHNPCSGPGLEGITTLRNAFTLNSNLKRLFLSDTELSSEGAIALAEFLPEARSLIHLDLTENLQIDIAGVMALAVSVKMNKSLRCLDLNVPPNAPDFARLSQDILASCIRNTELAQRRAQQKGVKAPIAAPIYKSTLARAAKEKEESVRLQAANKQLEQIAAAGESTASNAASESQQHDADGRSATRITDAAQECVNVLRELLEREREHDKVRARERDSIRRPDGTVAGRTMSEFAQDLLLQSKQLRAKLVNALGVMQEGDTLERALRVNDELDAVTVQLNDFYAGGRAESTEEHIGADAVHVNADTSASTAAAGQLLEVPRNMDEDGLSSPNFSIGSDDEDDEDAGAPARTSAGAASLVSEASLLLASSSEAALAGLGIGDVATAARDIPSEADAGEQIDPETALANNRAKGQLSEEGEIFRRAKSLSIGEEEEEENATVDDKLGAATNSEVATGETSASSIDAVRTSANDDVDTAVASSDDTVSDDRTEVSGEELRKELLGTHVPRRGSASSTTSAAGVAAVSFVGGNARQNEATLISPSQLVPEQAN